jgi:aspartate aminotransferase
VIYVDAISKWLVGTGLRLGWAVVPPYLYEPIRDFMGHVGGWGPRPVQLATAHFLEHPTAFTDFQKYLCTNLQDRLYAAYYFFKGMQAAGFPINCTIPQGAIYLSVQFNIIGRETSTGKILLTNADIQCYILNAAYLAMVPFQAFSLWENTGWFRLSVGAVSLEDLSVGLIRLRQAISNLV